MLKRRLTEPFGKAGLTVAILALVLAMVGGAYAKGLFTKAQEKKIAQIAKKYAGKPGAAGPAGPAGTNGTNGKDGTNGAPGAAGKSVAVSAIAKPGCEGQAGAEVKQEGAPSGVKVCNGTTGFTKTLPSGESEKGEWNVGGPAAGANNLFESSVSYVIPLKAAPTTHYIKVGETPPSGCSGNVEEPGAEKGNLCIFAATEENSVELIEIGPTFKIYFPEVCKWETEACFGTNNPGREGEGSLYGFGLHGASKEEGLMKAAGTWAVTAE